MKRVYIILFIFLTSLISIHSSLSDVSTLSNSEIDSTEKYENIKIDKAEFYGNKIILLDKIQDIFSIKSGDLFNSNNLKKNIRELYSTLCYRSTILEIFAE